MSNHDVQQIADLAVRAARPTLEKLRGNIYAERDDHGRVQLRRLPQLPARVTLLDLASLLILSESADARAVLVGRTGITLASASFPEEEGKPLVNAVTRPLLGARPGGIIVGEFVTEHVPVTLGEDGAVDSVGTDTQNEANWQAGFQVIEDVDAFVGKEAADRWEHHLPLVKHPAFVEVEKMVATRDIGQAALVRLFRTTLAGFVDTATVNTFRTLDLKASEDGRSTINNGDSGLDRSLVRQVRTANGEQVPDEITLSVPVYDLAEEREERASVRVVVEATPGKDGGAPTFALTALHNDVVAAEEAAQRRLIHLCEEKFPLVLRGDLTRA